MRSLPLLFLFCACGRHEPPPATATVGEHFDGDWSPQPAENAEVVATVNGANIYAADVMRQAAAENQTPAQALDTLVSAELLAQEARRRGLTDDPEVVEARKKVRVRRLVEKTFLPSFGSPADVPKEDVDRALRVASVQYHFDHREQRLVGYARIELANNASPDEEARARTIAAGFTALARAAQPKNKADLLNLLMLYDRGMGGGDIGREIGGMVPEFGKAAFALGKVGEVSDPVRTRWGWDVLILFAINPERHASREDAIAEVREGMFDSSRREAFLRWADGLVARARVYRNDELLGAIGEGLW